MSIWSKCINKRNGTNQAEVPNSNLINNPHVLTYKCSPLYLGKEGVITLKSGTREIYIHYSEKDGLGWIFKSLIPYKVLFSYNDGAYYINDSTRNKYSDLILQLDLLKTNAHNQHFSRSFAQLEIITSVFLGRLTTE